MSLLDWDTGEPNARNHALALLLRHFAPGDTMVATATGAHGSDPRVHAQAFRTTKGHRTILLINKTSDPLAVSLPPGLGGAHLEQTGVDAAGGAGINDGVAVLDAHATAVVSYPDEHVGSPGSPFARRAH